MFHAEHGETEQVFQTAHGSSGGATGGFTPTQEEIDSWENDVLLSLSAKQQNDIIERAEDSFANAEADADVADGNTDASAAPPEPHTDFTFADFSLSHHEPPERVPVPSLVSTTQYTAAVASPSSSSLSSGGVVGILFVAALMIAAVAFLIRYRRHRSGGTLSTGRMKKQQLRFQQAFRKAERQVVSQHRNLNDRDHSSPSSASALFHDDAALGSIKFTGSDDVENDKFHVEVEGGGNNGSTGSTSPRSLTGSFRGSPTNSGTGSFRGSLRNGHASFSGSGSGSGSGDDQDQNQVDFILDSQILQHMN